MSHSESDYRMMSKFRAHFANPKYALIEFTLALILSQAISFILFSWLAPDTILNEIDMLRWLAEPVLFIAIYLTLGRNWKKAGLSIRFKNNGLYFLLALTLAPALSGILLLINHMSGMVVLTAEQMQQALMVGAAAIIGLFIKNILEEFIFRGYLTERFLTLGIHRIKGHLLTGVLWAIWHLSYWSLLLPEDKIMEVSGLSTTLFILLGFIFLPLNSILLGELRIKTGSIWAAVILHTMNNAFMAALVAVNAVPKGDLTAMLFTPVDFGLIYALSSATIGYFIWKSDRSNQA